MRLNSPNRLLLLLVLIVLPATIGCRQANLSSHWRGHQVRIDGEDDDWKDARVYIEDAGITMGVLNDAQDLYLTMSVIDQGFQTQIVRRGFIIWFDKKGGKRKGFGVRFPLGMREQLAQELASDFYAQGQPGTYGPGGYRGPGGFGGPDGFDLQRPMEPGRLEDMFERLMEGAEMELLSLNPNDRQRVPLATGEEILMQVAYANGRLIYELRVPLDRVIQPEKKGTAIGVGFEIPELDLQSLRRAQQATAEGELSGGRAGALGGATSLGAGRGGYAEDGTYGRRRRRATVMPLEAFELWVKVHLAKAPGV